MSVVSFALAVVFIIRLFSTSAFRVPKKQKCLEKSEISSLILTSWINSWNDRLFADMTLTMHKNQVHWFGNMLLWASQFTKSASLPAGAGCKTREWIVAFFTVFVLTLQTGFAACWCFWCSANESSIEQVCLPLFYTMCKEALLQTKRIFATNAPSKGAQMRRTTRAFAQWNLISRTCNIPKRWKSTKTRRSYLNWMCGL